MIAADDDSATGTLKRNEHIEYMAEAAAMVPAAAMMRIEVW